MSTVAQKIVHRKLQIKLPKISFLFLLLFCNYSLANGFNYEICYGPINLESKKVIIEYLQKVDSKLDFQENVYVSQCAYVTGLYKKSLKFTNFALSENSAKYEILALKAKSLFELNRFQDAEKTLKFLYENKMAEADDIQLLADVLVNLDRAPEALNLLSKELDVLRRINKFNENGTIRIHYDEVDLYMKKSNIQCDQKNYKECAETLKEGFSRSNGSIYLFDALIFSLKMNGKINEIDSLLKNNCETVAISKSIYCKPMAIISN